MTEKTIFKMNGFAALVIAIVCIVGGVLLVINGVSTLEKILAIVAVLLGLIIATSLTIVQPNEAKVLTFFGTYLGVIREQGLWATIPFTFKRRVSLRVTNFNSEKLKVNDLEGNPIEIAAVVVYKVRDAAKALFDVENYEKFIQIQSETGIRHIASTYAYDSFESSGNALTLRQNSDEVADVLMSDLQKRLEVAGVDVIEARIMHLAYSSEIASAMLQRQQAQAVLSARKVIVDGAVGLVKAAIDQLAEQEIVELDEEKKAQMVNNLMVAIVSEKGTQPIINTGSIY
ncbi:SPFH domain-containing protein [Bacillus salipaludis]|uniref:SPFH domain-containing protein n=1 Tax=Bacillus salipaludis TaxID=2547811 RepID=A0A4R5VQQ7_9BACI|nr:SPFH domain-containing protein [Bacillus salipaludis]MDQ6598752.1 SPFH domain-containing protein [Bacillus salipaludis]TDK60706.1 SPFH domain-containing protein [Bacillus salipaludis]